MTANTDLSKPRRMPRLYTRLVFLALGVLVLAAAAPFLWAGYHAYTAESAWKRYHNSEALAHFDACLKIWPWSHSTRLHLSAAQAARREGNFDKASELIHECQDTLHDESPEVVLEWAMLRAARGDLDATIGPLRQAGREQPHMLPLIYEALAEGYLIMSRILEAVRATDAWLALEPDNPQAWFVRGKIHRQVGASQSTAADYRRVLELDPERTEARWWFALALIEIGRYQEANQQLEIYERSHPQDVQVHVRRAICLGRLERTEEARRLLDSVLAEHPHHGLALLTRGQILMADEKYIDAEPWLRDAARVLPYDLKTQNALWECLRQQGKTQEAEAQRERSESLRELRTQQSEILTRLMQQNPDDPALHCKLGTLYLQLGSPQIGEAWLLSALRLDEHYAPALEELAKHYQKLGDNERAEEYRQRAQSVKNRPSELPDASTKRR